MAYAYYVLRTIDHTLVGSSDSTNFTFPISLTLGVLKSMDNGGHVQSNSGFDIGITSGDGSTPWNFQLKSYDAVNGTLVMYAQCPTLSHTADTTYRITYGDSGITTDQSTTATWDSSHDYVDALDTSGGNVSAVDQTANGITATVNSGVTAGTGLIAGDAVFSGSSGGIVTATNAAFQTSGDQTVSVSVKFNTIGSGENSMMVERDDDSGAWAVALELSNSNVRFATTDATPATTAIIGGTTLVTGTWYRLAGRFDHANNLLDVYLNGASDAASVSTSTQTLRVGSGDYTFGKLGHQAGRNFDGQMDEIRIAHTVRSVDWLLAEFNSIHNAASFSTGTAETSTGVVTGPPSRYVFRSFRTSPRR